MASILLLQALEQEWAVLVCSRWSRQRLHVWGESEPALVGYVSLDQVLGDIRHADTGRSRELCWALLALVEGDELARRAMLQAMMPALTNELKRVMLPARNDPSSSFDRNDNEVEQVLIAAASEAVASNAGSRSAWPMSDLVRRTHRLVIRALKADRRWREHNLVDEGLDTRPPPEPRTAGDTTVNPILELVGVIDAVRAMDIISEPERDLIVATRCAGYGLGELVSVLGASSDTLKHRRARAEAKMIAGVAQLNRMEAAS